MKKILTTLILTTLVVAPVIGLVTMANAGTEIVAPYDAGFTTIEGLFAKIDQITTYIFTGLLCLAAIFLIVAGYFYITAGGDPEKIKKAREMLINALIGLAVGLAAKGLIAVIQSFITTS